MGLLRKLLMRSDKNYENINSDQDRNSNIPVKPFKERKSLSERREEVKTIRSKFPKKIPVIVERHKTETSLPQMDKVKFLVPQELSLAQLATIVRNRLAISSTQTLFLFCSKSKLQPLLTTRVTQLYCQSKDEDGFLYLAYASQESFG